MNYIPRGFHLEESCMTNGGILKFIFCILPINRILQGGNHDLALVQT